MMMWFIQGRCPFLASFMYSLKTNPDRPTPSWQVTQRIQMVCRNYNGKQIRLRPGVFTSGITGRPVPLSGLPHLGLVRPLRLPDGVSPNVFANLAQSLTGLFHIDIMQTSGIVRLYSHYTPKVTNPIRNPNLSGFSSLSNRPIRLQVAESKKVI